MREQRWRDNICQLAASPSHSFYWCLTSKHVPTVYTVTKKGENSFLLENRIDTPQQLNPTIPLALSNLVMDCISVRPQKRPADMEQVVTRLELARHTLQKPRISPDLLADDSNCPSMTRM